jgi:hypothetical protein
LRRRGYDAKDVALYEGTSVASGAFQVGLEIYFTTPINKQKMKEAILGMLAAHPLKEGEKMKLILFSGGGQAGIEAAEELGREKGIQFSDIFLLDTPVFISADLSNIEKIHLFRGDKISSIGVFSPLFPGLMGEVGGFRMANFLNFSKIRTYIFSGYGHLDFINREKISVVIDQIQTILNQKEV